MRASFSAAAAAMTFATSIALAQVPAPIGALTGVRGPDYPDSPDRCEALAELALPELIALEAESVAAGPFDIPAGGPRPSTTVELPAHCRVRGTVAPAINFEVWLPEAAAWNGRFLGVGGGGYAGVVSYGAMVGALDGGYVTASTDTGHRAGDLEWLSDPRRYRDFGYRAIYEMTSKAKAILTQFYDRPADFHYFNGCSTGGRQGLMEAQRFPTDYDGIVSGAPVNQLSSLTAANVWTAQASKPITDESILTQDDLALVNDAVIAQCDTHDGVTDGVIGNPARCDFDPGTLHCLAGQNGQCLAAEQVNALRRIYAGPRHAVTREPIYPGLARGSERTWATVTAPGLFVLTLEQLRRSVYEDPGWDDWRSFDFADDLELVRERVGTVLDAADPDLSLFRDNGGKLIVYHGWNDSLATPGGSIVYHDKVEATLDSVPNPSGQDTRDFFRLFLVPGMNHCAGGVGASVFDAQRAIEDWVERGMAPDRIEARHVENGQTMFARPLCPYPEVARYRGSGDPSNASSFDCSR